MIWCAISCRHDNMKIRHFLTLLDLSPAELRDHCDNDWVRRFFRREADEAGESEVTTA